MTQMPSPIAPAPSVVAAVPKKRPGGLTALAVLNFVFAGFGIIASLMLLALLAVADAVVQGGARAAASDGHQVAVQVAQQAHVAAGAVYLLLFLGLIAAALLLTAGVGYIKMSKTAGYVVGHVWAILAILNVILNLSMTPSGFGFFAIVGLAYPVLTLILLNTSFKKCFA